MAKELRQRFRRRSMPLRKGDEVEIMTGRFEGKKGKVSKINYKFYQVYVDGVMIKRTDGTERQAPLHASNLKITNLNLTDKQRIRVLERKGKVEIPKQEVKQEVKPEEKKVAVEQKPKIEEKKTEKKVEKKIEKDVAKTKTETRTKK